VSELLYDLLGFAYWAAIAGGVLWWIWSMRRGRRPRARTPREEAELAGLRAAMDRGRRQPSGQPHSSSLMPLRADRSGLKVGDAERTEPGRVGRLSD